MALKLLITDFDGTLVDTFEANFRAYREAFELVGLKLSREFYRQCFGFRFDRFMDAARIMDEDVRRRVREQKSVCYPQHFACLRVNRPLLEFMRAFRRSGGKTAIASTARERNLRNALEHIGAVDDFDLILAGEAVENGKPSPEIYLNVLDRMAVAAEDAIIFEDSDVGFRAAEAAGVGYIAVNPNFFSNGN